MRLCMIAYCQLYSGNDREQTSISDLEHKLKMFLPALAEAVISMLLFSELVQASPNVVHIELQQCNQTSRGVRLLFNNRKGNDMQVICLRENHEYRWKFVDGSPTYGEIFNPATDCSDLLDNLANAQDGFYWVKLHGTTKVRKVWCDMHTDGGGFMLVAMKDSPVTWTVPSNSTPVQPQGPPHWSSILGDVVIEDIGVQFSINKTFQGTEAHWFYHLKQTRQLKQLFINDKATGCKKSGPGIGDVMYVKDVLTGSIATTNFKCSIFGPHTHPNLGWARMNYCLQHACENGYGVIPGPFPFPYGQFGSFSYSAVSSSSGTQRNSTSFVGCDGGKCCACFGPKGGRQNYCGPECTALNGGTVTKKAFVWFWVRTRMPRRVWKRCMEFKMENSVGVLENYFIDLRTGTTRKGSCSEQFKTFLNEGTLTVSGKESFEKIPNVPGLVSYRKDSKQLYVNEGSQWQALSSEKELRQLQQRVKIQENKMSVQEIKIQSQQTKIQSQETKIQSQETKIQSQETKIQSQETKIQSQDNTMKKLENEVQGLVNRIDIRHAATCSVIHKRQASVTSGKYYINPQGLTSSALVQVYCDMSSKNGVGVTEIGHDSESAIKVDGYEVPGSYKRSIKYNIAMTQIVAIIQQSKQCEQFVKYKCYNAGFWFSGPTSWWVSRDGAQMKYWGGAKANSGKCACGMSNSCVDRTQPCNCDQNTNIWTEDSGYLTDKNTLPVAQLRFGDTSTISGHAEFGYHTVGKLQCWG